MPTISPDVMNYTLTLLASSSSLLLSSSHYDLTNNSATTSTQAAVAAAASTTTLIDNLNITSAATKESVGQYMRITSPSTASVLSSAASSSLSSPSTPLIFTGGGALAGAINVNDTGGGGILDDGWSNKSHNNIINNGLVQATFCILYTNIFVLGIFGNVLVCYVVFRNKAMQTVTNLFITNLALSDILLCMLAVPFTPLYTFLGGWVFGTAICHIVPYAQGCSVYISTLTLTSIAVDRFFVIIYPFHPRMKLSTCISIIISIWVVSLLITMPYGYYVKFYSSNYTGTWTWYCEENWPDEDYRRIYGSVTSSLQFMFPFLIISICYICVSLKLNDRANTRPGSRNSRREEADRDRKKRTNRMLIAMVVIFGISWLPINVVNILYDFYSKSDEWVYYNVMFFIAHCAAMSSACYNPFLYAWLNENFRKEFKQVLPCFKSIRSHTVSVNGEKTRLKLARICNGGNNDTVQETLVQSSENKANNPQSHHIIPRGPTALDERTIPVLKNCTPKTKVDDILQAETTAPPPTFTASQETIVLPSGVLETPFDAPMTPSDKLPSPMHLTTNGGPGTSSESRRTPQRVGFIIANEVTENGTKAKSEFNHLGFL